MKLWRLIDRKFFERGRIRSEIFKLTSEEIGFAGRFIEDSGRTIAVVRDLQRAGWSHAKATAAELTVYVLEYRHGHDILKPVSEEKLTESKKVALDQTYKRRLLDGLWPPQKVF